jgi:protein TonB
MIIKMVRDTVKLASIRTNVPPPPPPPGDKVTQDKTPVPDAPPPPPPPPPVDQKDKKDAYVMVEEMPQFPGGESAMMFWISSNIKYPGDAAKKNITGEVLVNFVVGNNGKIKNVKIEKSVNPLLDAEAVRVISSMPDWKPGTQGGKSVEVNIRVPINFALDKVSR